MSLKRDHFTLLHPAKSTPPPHISRISQRGTTHGLKNNPVTNSQGLSRLHIFPSASQVKPTALNIAYRSFSVDMLACVPAKDVTFLCTQFSMNQGDAGHFFELSPAGLPSSSAPPWTQSHPSVVPSLPNSGCSPSAHLQELLRNSELSPDFILLPKHHASFS